MLQNFLQQKYKTTKNNFLEKKFNFLKEAISTVKTSGTLIPSSRFLAEKMLKHIDFEKAKLIVELGSGNGAITKRILSKMNPRTKLICFEINDTFYEELLKINNSQVTILKASAEDIIEEINKLNYKEADYIVSGLPLSILPKKLSESILIESHKVLKKEGRFVQFQYSLDYYKKLKKIFNKKNVSLNFEPINFPPAFIYSCIKK